MKRPDWEKIYERTAHTPRRDAELVDVTRETLRIALSAVRKEIARDGYRNYKAAEAEIAEALAEPAAMP